jgi:hypothetical protein
MNRILYIQYWGKSVNSSNFDAGISLSKKSDLFLVHNLSDFFSDEKTYLNIKRYCKDNGVNKIIFSYAISCELSLEEINFLRHDFVIGMIFDDSVQHFTYHFRFLTQVIDIAICLDPSDLSLFKTYKLDTMLFPIAGIGQYDLIIDHPLINYDERPNNLLYMGRIDRSGRAELVDNLSKKFKITAFGEGTSGGYISNEHYVSNMFNSKICINNSGISRDRHIGRADPIEMRRVQTKGRLYQYLLAGSLVISDWSPMVDDFLVDGEDYIVANNQIEWEEKISYYLNNSEEAKIIANSGREKILARTDINKFIDAICNYKKRQEVISSIYINNSYIFSCYLMSYKELKNYSKNNNFKIQNLTFLNYIMLFKNQYYWLFLLKYTLRKLHNKIK